MNILKYSLDITATYEDEFSVNGLFETCRVWLWDELQTYHKLVSPTAHTGYMKWRASCGFENPSVASASLEADYLKIRAAFEAHPIDPKMQLSMLFGINRVGNIRLLERPHEDSYNVRVVDVNFEQELTAGEMHK
jgi:hypothetical protein